MPEVPRVRLEVRDDSDTIHEVQPLREGEITLVDIALLPSATFFSQGGAPTARRTGTLVLEP